MCVHSASSVHCTSVKRPLCWANWGAHEQAVDPFFWNVQWRRGRQNPRVTKKTTDGKLESDRRTTNQGQGGRDPQPQSLTRGRRVTLTPSFSSPTYFSPEDQNRRGSASSLRTSPAQASRQDFCLAVRCQGKDPGNPTHGRLCRGRSLSVAGRELLGARLQSEGPQPWI